MLYKKAAGKKSVTCANIHSDIPTLPICFRRCLSLFVRLSVSLFDCLPVIAVCLSDSLSVCLNTNTKSTVLRKLQQMMEGVEDTFEARKRKLLIY